MEDVMLTDNAQTQNIITEDSKKKKKTNDVIAG